MSVHSTYNGQPITWNGTRWELDGSDTHCPVCREDQNPDGSDHCIGHIPGAISACCGHGAANPYVVFPDIETMLIVCRGEAVNGLASGDLIPRAKVQRLVEAAGKVPETIPSYPHLRPLSKDDFDELRAALADLEVE